MRYSRKWPVYAQQWDDMAINLEKRAEYKRVCEFIMLPANISQYQAVALVTGVPWTLTAAIHKRESDPDKRDNPRFDTYLGNGQPLNKKTTIVPRGRGPFPSFAAGAQDAFKLDGLDVVKDWRLEKQLYWAEILNGTGYDMRGLSSPYIWAGTTIQRAGKFTSDGTFSASTWDGQVGVAGILWTLEHDFQAVSFVRED